MERASGEFRGARGEEGGCRGWFVVERVFGAEMGGYLDGREAWGDLAEGKLAGNGGAAGGEATEAGGESGGGLIGFGV